MNIRFPWTDQEIERARKSRRAGMSSAEIGALLGRTTKAVTQKLSKDKGPVARQVPTAKVGNRVVRIAPVGHVSSIDDCGGYNDVMPAGHRTSCGAIGIQPWWPVPGYPRV